MNLRLKRVFFAEKYTIGKLYIDGEYFCDTLEDKVRHFGEHGEGKVFGKTAIPIGEYKIDITYSNRFKKPMPILLNVPFFEGIRIHPGNTDKDTHGCILVGKNTEPGKVTNSASVFSSLFSMIKNRESEEIKIIIT